MLVKQRQRFYDAIGDCINNRFCSLIKQYKYIFFKQYDQGSFYLNLQKYKTHFFTKKRHFHPKRVKK